MLRLVEDKIPDRSKLPTDMDFKEQPPMFNLVSDIWLGVLASLTLESLHSLSYASRQFLALLDSSDTHRTWIRKFQDELEMPCALPNTFNGAATPRRTYAALYRRFRRFLGFFQPSFPTFRGGLLRISLQANGTILGQRIEVVNQLLKATQKRPLSIRQSTTVDCFEPSIVATEIFRITLKETGPVVQCTRRPGSDFHPADLAEGNSPFANESALVRRLAKFQHPDKRGLWPHPESTPMPEDVGSSIYVGSLDDHAAVVVESLSNSYFPEPTSGSQQSRKQKSFISPVSTFHITCAHGCQLRLLRLYHQTPSFLGASTVPIPPRINITPTYSHLHLRSKDPIDMFPELPITPKEGIWCGSIGPGVAEDGRTPLGLFLFRYVAVNSLEDDEKGDFEDVMSISENGSQANGNGLGSGYEGPFWLQDSDSERPRSRSADSEVDVESVMNLPPRLDAAASPRRPRPNNTPSASGSPFPSSFPMAASHASSSDDDVRYELRCYSITGNMRIPRGELLFRSAMWESMTLRIQRDTPLDADNADEDDEEDEVSADELPEFLHARFYETRLSTAQFGYVSKRELGPEEVALAVLSDDEVLLHDGTVQDGGRVYRFRWLW